MRMAEADAGMVPRSLRFDIEPCDRVLSLFPAPQPLITILQPRTSTL
jgi:hypothetical protein